MIDEKERQGDLFAGSFQPSAVSTQAADDRQVARQIDKSPEKSEKNATLGATLSPSQCNMFLCCSAKGWPKNKMTG